MQSVMGLVPADGSNGAHSLFCIFDATTGEKVTCPESSAAYAFCSAIVDYTTPPHRLWVFCSAWDRANHTYCGPGASWGCGACGDAERGVGPGCHVAAWSSEDLVTWSKPVAAITLPLNQTVPNVGASMVPHAAATVLPNVPKHQAFMALENGAFPMAINVGDDRDLSKNWRLLPVNRSSDACKHSTAHVTCEPGVACPSTRYNPVDQYYYVFGGGNDITITRSKDLVRETFLPRICSRTLMDCGSLQPSIYADVRSTMTSSQSKVTWERRNMSMMTHCIAEEVCLHYRKPCLPDAISAEECCFKSPDCSAASGEAQIASAYFTGYWRNYSDCRGGRLGQKGSHCRRDYFSNMSQWMWSVNDADFCDENGKGPTRFVYATGEQTAPANASRAGGSGGYHIGIYPGNEFEFLSSFW